MRSSEQHTQSPSCRFWILVSVLDPWFAPSGRDVPSPHIYLPITLAHERPMNASTATRSANQLRHSSYHCSGLLPNTMNVCADRWFSKNERPPGDLRQLDDPMTR